MTGRRAALCHAVLAGRRAVIDALSAHIGTSHAVQAKVRPLRDLAGLAQAGLNSRALKLKRVAHDFLGGADSLLAEVGQLVLHLLLCVKGALRLGGQRLRNRRRVLVGRKLFFGRGSRARHKLASFVVGALIASRVVVGQRLVVAGLVKRAIADALRAERAVNVGVGQPRSCASGIDISRALRLGCGLIVNRRWCCD